MTAAVELRLGDVCDTALTGYDVITANLDGPMLMKAARRLMLATVPGGRLIISGFTGDEVTNLLAMFDQLEPLESGLRRWVVLCGARGASF